MVKVFVAAYKAKKDMVFAQVCEFSAVPRIGELLVLPGHENDRFKVNEVMHLANKSESLEHNLHVYCEIEQ